MIYIEEFLMAQVREKFATQVDSRVLRKVRKLAAQEGRQLQVLVEEALTDLIDKRQGFKPRTAVMAAYLSSIERFGPLYKKLAE
jgi:predicted transcriptional regulator